MSNSQNKAERTFVALSNLLSYSYKLEKDLDYWEQRKSSR